MQRTLPILAALVTLGCAEPLQGDQDILAIGDSLLSFHTPDADIATVAAETLGMSVELGSVGGTTMLGDPGESIPGSYVSGEFGVLIASGGGNDLATCGCEGRCDDVIDRLVTEEAESGAIVELVDRAAYDGKTVAWVGYMRPLPDAEEFRGCDAELDTLRERLRTLEERVPEMVFVDGAELGTGSERELYEPDGYHPSPKGSARLGEAVAERLSELLD